MNFYFGYYGVLLLTCALTGCLLVRRNWPGWSKLLVILSCVTLVVESLTFVLSHMYVDYLLWYNCWSLLETVTLLYILSGKITLSSGRRLRRLLLIALVPGTVLCYIWYPFFHKFNGCAVLFYLFLELTAACVALVDILKKVYDKPMYKEPMFWLATGMLFFCSLFIVVFSLGQFFNRLTYPVYLPFACSANTFMYGGFIACFIALRREGRESVGVSSRV